MSKRTPLHAMPGGCGSSAELLEDRTLLSATISINSPSIAEGNAGNVNLDFTVTRSGDLQTDVVVSYTTVDGTAKAGTDYVAKTGFLKFTAGQTTATISVPVIGNTVGELDKQFTVSLTAAANVPTFTGKTDVATGAGATALAIADFNGDGKLDRAVADFSANLVSVLLNTTAAAGATPTFATKSDFATATGPTSVSAADVNNDGKPDLIVTNRDSGTVSVLLNTTATAAATPTFAAKVDFGTGAFPYSVAVADFNNDGKPDVAVANRDSDSISVLLNTTAAGAATPTFSAKTDFTAGDGPYSIAVGDINADGKPDIAVANSNGTGASIFLNTTATGATTPVFSAKTDVATGNGPSSVALSDLNGDGKVDLAVTNYLSGTLSVMFNTSAAGATTPTFAPKVDFGTALGPYAVTAADLNNDGRPDLAVANYEANGVTVFLNVTSPGTTTPLFTPLSDLGAGSSPAAVIAGDLNADGKVELMSANYTSSNVSFFVNNVSLQAPTIANAQGIGTILNDDPLTTLDIDGDGTITAFTDGDLVLAYLFGLPDAQLQPFVSGNATRSLTEIRAYLDGLKNSGQLDIDGNGSAEAFTDGDLVLAYLFGLGDPQLQPFIAGNATRSVAQIRADLDLKTGNGSNTPGIAPSSASPAVAASSRAVEPSWNMIQSIATDNAAVAGLLDATTDDGTGQPASSRRAGRNRAGLTKTG